MRVEIDTHTHTLASGHAYNTLNEMAQAAADKGLKGLAITEHAPEMPGTCHLFYFQNLRIVPRKKYGIELLLGTELNIMNAAGGDRSPGFGSWKDLILQSPVFICRVLKMNGQ